MARDPYLWQRGRQWYFRLAIPRPLRRYFLSKTGKPLPRVVEPLSDSHEVAKVEAAQRYAACMAVFARLKAGEQMTPAQAKAALRGPDEGSLINEALRRWHAERPNPWEDYGRLGPIFAQVFGNAAAEQPAPVASAAPMPIAPAAGGETVTEALEEWIKHRMKTKPSKPDTYKGHRTRLRVFVDKHGDLPLTDVTRAMAYDFLSGLGKANRTRNNYTATMSYIFNFAKQRGRFTGENPFAGQTVDDVGDSYEPFKVEELQKLFDNLPRDTNPTKHSPATALPWVALIANFSGACLEEICQLSLDDIREETVNGGTVTVFDIHNGDAEHKLKNDVARPRYLPMHSALVKAGLLDYIANVRKQGHTMLFPGLKRRASKGNKLSPEVGGRFGKTLRRLGLKRPGLCFHSFRHTVQKMLEEVARAPLSERARVLGHVLENVTDKYGKGKAGYRQAGPGLAIAKGTVERITYEGLRP
jgi:integrase